MKHLSYKSISTICLSIILFSASCKKDSLNAGPPVCTTCNNLTLNTLMINDSNWVKQEDGNYTSDITKIVERSGASVGQVYGINIKNENIPQELFPEVSASYMDGYIYASVDLSKNHGTCILTFEFSREEHEGEVHPADALPFKSVEIEVLLVNQHN